ncbi:hypothetical protein [Glacieibacterium frigidum]|uniref:Uncharacterized protein n=1 Tax=Glacieibacterium frigidum TaxID=2593303 RepID=A0A552UGP7_9SPHN|nr:hypothetical protein [Glacieibacterium frigidum]TRW17357.1 hypothetical protein FMM06_04060 [Glacieibacterium frigidum]
MLRRLGAVLLLLTPSAVPAQMYFNLAPTQAMSNLTMQPVRQQAALARAKARRAAGGATIGQVAAGGAMSTAAFSSAALAYQPSRTLARETVEGFVSRLLGKDPAAAQAVAEQFSRHDYGSIYRGIVAPFGLRDNNAADALTAYTVLGWMIATGAGDPGHASVAAARQQLGARMAANPTLSTPANRARVGEELKLLFVTLHAGWQSARREGNLRKYSDGVAATFAQQGTDLRALRLTPDGLVAA